MPRVLEISRTPLFKYCLPADTTWFSLGASLVPGNEVCEAQRFTVRNVLRLIRDLRRGAYDLVVLPAVTIGYAYDTQRIKRWLRRLVRFGASRRLTASLLAAVLRWHRTTVVFTDVSDPPQLSYEACALVPEFLLYFKREYDPAETLRAGARWEAINRRVVPWSLFLPTTEVQTDATHKKHDVFFSGVCNSVPRHEGLPRLRRLAARGYRIDAPEERLGYQEFMQRMAEAWLVWSPAGFGWDCYRHYESAYAGAVPLINDPPASRPLPFEDGAECCYYRSEGEGLEETIERALADKERLHAMAARARARVLRDHTRQALVARMQAAIVEHLRLENRQSALLDAWSPAPAAPAPGPAGNLPPAA